MKISSPKWVGEFKLQKTKKKSLFVCVMEEGNHLMPQLCCMFYGSNIMKGRFIFYIIILILETTFLYVQVVAVAFQNLHMSSC